MVPEPLGETNDKKITVGVYILRLNDGLLLIPESCHDRPRNTTEAFLNDIYNIVRETWCGKVMRLNNVIAYFATQTELRLRYFC